MDELVTNLSQETGLPEDKARVAVDTVVDYIKSKLPTTVADQVDNTPGGWRQQHLRTAGRNSGQEVSLKMEELCLLYCGGSSLA